MGEGWVGRQAAYCVALQNTYVKNQSEFTSRLCVLQFSVKVLCFVFVVYEENEIENGVVFPQSSVFCAKFSPVIWNNPTRRLKQKQKQENKHLSC